MSCPFPPVPPPRPQTNDPPLPPLPEPPLPPLPMPPESQVCPVEPEVRGGGSSSSMMSNTYAASASSSAHQTDTQQRNHKKQQQQPVVDTQSQVSTATPAHRLSQTRRNNVSFLRITNNFAPAVNFSYVFFLRTAHICYRFIAVCVILTTVQNRSNVHFGFSLLNN
jgi:hypothetical protein